MNTYRGTVQQLSTAQKTSKGAPAYSRFVNRRAGRYLAAAAYRSGRTPNEVTAVSAAFSAVAIALVARSGPSVALGVVVAVLLAVGYAFDSADGQLARLRGGGTPAGEWLDHVVDSAKICALHLAVLVSFYRFGGRSDGELAVPLLWTFVATVSFFVIILNDQIRRGARYGGAGHGRRVGGPQPAWSPRPTTAYSCCRSCCSVGIDGFLAVYARSWWPTPPFSRWPW